MADHLNKPYKGKLINRLISPDKKNDLKEYANSLVQIPLSQKSLFDLELIASGGFSPLNGFMTKKEYENVLYNLKLDDSTLWPVPICMDIEKKNYEKIKNVDEIALTDKEGFQQGILEIEDIFEIDLKKEIKNLYLTSNNQHPGIKNLVRSKSSHYVGGKITLTEMPKHYDFKKHRYSPKELRDYFIRTGWNNVAVFQTRHPIHRLQYELCLRVIKEKKKKLLINQVAGITHPKDFDRYTRVRATDRIINTFPLNSTHLNLIPLHMRFTGYKDALLHSIISKNYGCSDIIIGHGHSNPKHSNGKFFYDNEIIKEKADQYSKEIGINVIPLSEMRYMYFDEDYRFIDEIPSNTQSLSISGDEIRNRIKQGKKIPSWASFDNVIDEIEKNYPPPSKQGFTVFLTGLPSAGKSTIAKVLHSKFLEIGKRPVTLLDGDIVRRNLSNELNFSKEHRNINVERIGFVANEITKNRGIAICAPIAPYKYTRDKIRDNIEQNGGFIEVFISTPLNICEKRDRKGMYNKARKGLIKDFTGIDAPYEKPKNPEVIIDTTDLSPEESAQKVILELTRLGYF